MPSQPEPWYKIVMSQNVLIFRMITIMTLLFNAQIMLSLICSQYCKIKSYINSTIEKATIVYTSKEQKKDSHRKDRTYDHRFNSPK